VPTGRPCVDPLHTERQGGECKECKRARQAKWKRENPEREKAQQAKWKRENRERVKAYDAKRYAENREREKARQAKRYAENPEREKARQAKWQRDNPERVNANSAKWRAAHPGKKNALTAKRRALKRAQTCTCCTPQQFADVYVQANKLGREVDHTKPLALGGLHCVKNLEGLTPAIHRFKTAECDIPRIAAARRAKSNLAA
jgi:hypothetical protein